MSDQPILDRIFDDTFPDRLKALLVRALRVGYEHAQEIHEPEYGSNQFTFGTNLWHFIVKELERIIPTANGNIAIQRDGLLVRLCVRKFKIAVHKVGRHANDDIWHSFPYNDGAINEMVYQPYLTGLAPNLLEADRLVLAHMGNPVDGLGAAYLCIPTRTENGRVVEWGYVYELFRDAGGATGIARSPTAPQGPTPDEATPIANLKLRTDREDTAAGH